jgi:hypothetical protein
MAAFDDLPADQKAVLQLVLRQGRTYGEIAGLLKISEDTVRDRALTALDALGPAGERLPADDQDAVADYLLGQNGGAGRERLDASPGDFVFIGPREIHREINPGDEPSEVVLFRIGSGPVVVNVER